MPEYFTAGCYVITGASGAGEPTVIAALGEFGYATFPEAALAVLASDRSATAAFFLG